MLLRPPSQRGLRQAVGLGIALAWDVRDGKFQGPGQLATGPVQGIEAGAAAGVFARHLPDHDLRIRIDVKLAGVHRDGALQGFHERDVLGDVVILAANPFRDADRAAGAAVDHHSNARRPGIPQAPAIDVGH